MRSQVLFFHITNVWRFGDNLTKKWKPTNNYSEYTFQIFSDKVFQWALWSFTKSEWFLTFNLSTYFKSMSHFIGNVFRKYSISNSWSYFSVYEIVSQLWQLAFVCLQSTMETSKQVMTNLFQDDKKIPADMMQQKLPSSPMAQYFWQIHI